MQFVPAPSGHAKLKPLGMGQVSCLMRFNLLLSWIPRRPNHIRFTRLRSLRLFVEGHLLLRFRFARMAQPLMRLDRSHCHFQLALVIAMG